MSESHDHPKQGFLKTYVFSFDHKMIGRQFLFLGLGMLILGGLLAMLVRWNLAHPEERGSLAILRMLPEKDYTVTYLPAEDENHNGVLDEGEDINKNGKLDGETAYITDKFYNTAFTMHATIMIFFAAMPILVGAFGNFLIPLMIGARDMAFPTLNMLSFWVTLVSGGIMLAAFFVAGGAAAGGWTSYAPLSAQANWTGVDWGQNLWCISLIVSGLASMMGSVNYITTVINMRAPGMKFFRMPLTIWAIFITAILILLALPVLTSALAMLLFDRMAGTAFFRPQAGGQPILWQHLFWFFGHPEVYVLVLPGMGIVSDILATFCRKPIFGYKAMAFSMMSIAFLGWIVWGHHMFISGMSPFLGTTFMISTMVIAVPSAIKTFNWLGTLWGGNIRFTTPMLFAIAFVINFVIGGLSGIFMASTPIDIYIHDTYFIVAHFHYVVAGIIFAVFAGLTFWFPKMFGRMMNETLGKLHFLGTFVFFHLTFFPMHILGMGGHMRRIYNPLQHDFLNPLIPINRLITISALCLGAFQIFFLVNFIWSLCFGRKADRNPWNANTLDWSSPTPGIHGNFEVLPTVYRGPYEYSVPGMAEDFLPQDRDLGKNAPAAH